MAAVVADTHAIIWYLFDQGRLSAPALRALDDAGSSGSSVSISAISIVEIRYLIEKGRLPPLVLERIDELLDQPDVALRCVPVGVGVARDLARIPREQVPDMPDRIIAATALHLGQPLVSRDRKIRASPIQTLW